MKTNNKGVAMIVALLTSFIFLMLVLTISVLSTSAYKNAHFRRDRAIALNLAEAGLADALYRMNYLDYDPDSNPATPDSALFQITSPNVATPWFEENSPFGNGSYKIYYTHIGDTNCITGDVAATDEVTVRSFSKNNFAGKIRTINVGVRGNNTAGNSLDDAAQGIAEAFNKHVIYADKVDYTAGTITGNIGYTDEINSNIPDPGATDLYTKTDIPDAQFSVPSPTEPAFPSASWDRTYTDGDWPGGTNDGIAPFDFFLDGYGSYDLATDTYTFTIVTLSDFNSYFSNGTNGPVTVNIDNLTTVDKSIGCPTNLAINNNKTIGSGALFAPAGNITIANTGITITGDLIVEGAALILDNVTVNGAVLCDNSIAFSGTPSTINIPDTNTRKAAIILKSGGVLIATIDLGKAPTVKFGTTSANQPKAGIIVYSTGGDTTLILNDKITWDSSVPIDKRTAIVYTAGSPAKAQIDVSNGFDGLLYANNDTGGAGDYGQINLTGGILIGSAIVGGIPPAGIYNINISAGTTLIWDKKNYTDTTSIFQNFSGGRRVYLPVIGSWKEE